MITSSSSSTVIKPLGSEVHPDPPSVYVNVDVPSEIAVTIPLLVMEATAGFELYHEPPEFGSKAVVEAIHKVSFPEIITVGLGLMVIGRVAFETHPVAKFVKVNVAVPVVRPVTIPVFETEATAGLLLVQVPPVLGDKEVAVFIQISDGPLMLTEGF